MDIEPRVQELLDRELPGLLACIATNDRNGYPLVIPVWYRWDGERILVWSLESRAWVQNVLRDPRVGLSIQDQNTDSLAVMMRGNASVETSDDSSIDEEILRITRRYVPETEVADYVETWKHLRTMVSMEPKKLFVWGGMPA